MAQRHCGHTAGQKYQALGAHMSRGTTKPVAEPIPHHRPAPPPPPRPNSLVSTSLCILAQGCWFQLGLGWRRPAHCLHFVVWPLYYQMLWDFSGAGGGEESSAVWPQDMAGIQREAGNQTLINAEFSLSSVTWDGYVSRILAPNVVHVVRHTRP